MRLSHELRTNVARALGVSCSQFVAVRNGLLGEIANLGF